MTSSGANVTARITAGASVAASVSTSAALGVDIGTQVYRMPDPYTGAYEVTPTQGTQTLSTSGLTMMADVVVNPIPSNYGLITHDGAGIRVS